MLRRRERTKTKTLARLQHTSIPGALPPSVTSLRDLVRFLNEARTTGGKRIIGIVEQMLRLEARVEPVNGLILPDLSLKKTDPTRFESVVRIDDETARLNRELSQYQFTPRAEIAVGGNGGAIQWATWWRGMGKDRPESHLRLRPTETLELILKLAQAGYLARLRRCSECGRWLYANFRHQKFCSMKCQQKQYTRTDQFKAKRRAYMREYNRKNFSKKRLKK